LQHFIADAYAAAGLEPSQIDSGAVILTGEALKRRNARAIADLFADQSGKFVCASAGHHLEAIMAAHGSGAVAYSRDARKTVLNIDIGGGTTKLALARGGVILGNAAIAIGGRLIAFAPDGTLARIEDPARQIARAVGIELELGAKLDAVERERLVATMVDVLVDTILGKPWQGLAAELALTTPLDRSLPVDVITFSGGVAEFVFAREHGEHADLGSETAAGIVAALTDKRIPYPVFDPGHGIRATVVGASQFTVQVSGNTILIANKDTLPLRNAPVVQLDAPLEETISAEAVAAEIGRALEAFDIVDGEQTVALAFRWQGDPLHARLHALARGICFGFARTIAAGQPLILLMDGDIARTLGEILRKELDVTSDIVSIDGIQLKQFDYVDIGELIEPTHVVPLIIKSLLFSGEA
jgi:ethanolamine utilization protein EutA